MGTGWATTTDGGVFKGNEVRWHFEDLEPSEEQNMDFALVAPSAWENVLSMREKVKKYPNDSETWGMFAKVHKEIFLGVKYNRVDVGGDELWKLSVDAYEKCLSLSPNDAQWHAGFAELLWARAYWDSWIDGEWSDPTPETFRALEEIRIALRLAPNDSVVQDIARAMSGYMPEGMIQNGDHYDFPWLTQTPTLRPPTPTDFPSLTPSAPAQTEIVSVAQATSTPLPAATDTPSVTPAQASPTPAPQQSSPLCGSAAFLPLIAVAWLAWKRR
jgi:hypothetical protein